MIADDIMATLVAAGLGQNTASNSDWMIRVGYMQAGPDKTICIQEAGGRPPETGQQVQYPTIQIRVRGAGDGYQDMRDKEQAIFNFLHAGNAPVDIGGNYVYCFALSSSPVPMGQDGNRRPSVVRNYRLMRTGP